MIDSRWTFLRISRSHRWHVWHGQSTIDGNIDLAMCRHPAVRMGRELSILFSAMPPLTETVCLNCIRQIRAVTR